MVLGRGVDFPCGVRCGLFGEPTAHTWWGWSQVGKLAGMNTMRRQARLFRLVRHADASGLRGTGTLAEGVEWSDGSVALRWRGPWPSTSTWDRVEALLAVHATDGRTLLHWSADPATPVPLQRERERGPDVVVRRSSRPPSRAADQPPPVLWLPAPGIDGLCARCGQVWPCLSCGP